MHSWQSDSHKVRTDSWEYSQLPKTRPLVIGILIVLWTSAGFAFEGQLRSLTEYYPTDIGKPTKTLIPRIELDLQHLEKFKKSLRWSVKAQVQTNTVATELPETLYADPNEAYVEYRHRKLKLRAGYNTLNWGTLDIYSPLDVVNQRQYFYPLAPQKRGSPMLEMNWSPPSWNMSLIYIPWQTRPSLPSRDSRWYPRQLLLNLQTSQGQIVPPQTLEYDIGDPVERDRAMSNNYGMNLEKQIGDFDFKFVYFEGAGAPSMLLDKQTDSQVISLDPYITQVKNPVYLHPLYYRQRTTGGGIALKTDALIVRAESSYQSSISAPNGDAFSDWQWQHAIGLEKTSEVLGNNVTGILNYYYGQYPQASSNIPTDTFRLWDNTLVAGLRWALTDDKLFYGSFMYNFVQLGSFFVVGYQNKFADRLRMDISWRQLGANKDGLLKTFERNQHAILELTYFF